ncbi:MAG: hypothetical protein KBB37_14385 [Bacteroidia bacterium]|nr:hypothetical protein [Bacteroidia bacterium]
MKTGLPRLLNSFPLKGAGVLGLLCTSFASYGSEIYDTQTLFVTTNTSPSEANLYRCSVDNKNGITGCSILNRDPYTINISAYGNDYLYLGENDGSLRNCLKDEPQRDNCDTFYSFGTPIKKVLQTPVPTAGQSDQLYVGLLNSYNMWKCDPHSLDKTTACGTRYFNNFDSNVNDMIYANKKLYIGLANGKMWQCDPTNQDGCGSRYFNVMHTKINSLAYGDFGGTTQIIYTGLDNGELRVCNANKQDGCGTTGDYYKYEAGITSLTLVSRVNQTNTTTVKNLYVGLSNGKLYECTPGSDGSLKQQCTLLSSALTQSVTSLQYLAYPNNSDIVYKIYAGSANGKILECTLGNSTASCGTPIDVLGGAPITSITAGANFLPDLIPGRGTGEKPLKQQFTSFNPFIVQSQQNLVYRNNSGCSDSNCISFNENPSLYSSASQLFSQDLATNDCYLNLTETLYVINANGELKLVEACSNIQNSATQRWVQMFKGYNTSDHQYNFSSIVVSDPYSSSTPLKVVHPSIDGDYPSPTTTNALKSQVYGAGAMVVSNGKILQFDNCSGHFLPSVANLYYTWQYLINKGFISSNVPFVPVTNDSGNCQTIKTT